ncbi:rRNA-processing protein EFG1 [Daucus carota subsp. sativus]|uniref:rRNA-processing protein EFG1 n=1 Tax=Daucus carota subsp. sativus TaxID=79200 RepID=UPI0007EF5F25|nr:PREDICTED: rRNA-processing protein EFG1 [Daucus carota subsp. sativus]
MGHGGYNKRKPPANNRRPKGATAAIDKPKPSKSKSSGSLKNQIRSTERFLRKDLPADVREVQEKKLEELKKQIELQTRLVNERKTFLLDRKKKFFERRKIERRMRRLEKQHRISAGQTQEAEISDQLLKLKEDLEYVRFFPKKEKYVPLFMGGDDTETVDRRNVLRKQIKANIIAAAASGKDLEETGSEDDGHLDPSEDDFFLIGSSSDEADADDEWTDKSTREQASSTSGKAASGMSSDEKTQRQLSARALMPPPGPSKRLSSVNVKPRFEGSSSKKPFTRRPEDFALSNSMSGSSFRNDGYSNLHAGNRSNPSLNFRNRAISNPRTDNNFSGNSGVRRNTISLTSNSSNLSSNSDARKPRRKRRPKKKKEQA